MELLSKSRDKTNWLSNKISVRKCGFRIDPPTFVVVLKKDKKYSQKLMPVRKFTSRSDVNQAVEVLISRHKELNVRLHAKLSTLTKIYFRIFQL